MPPELTCPRLTLRPLAAGDVDFYASVYTDAGLMREVGPVLDADAARRAFAAALRANSGGNPATAYWVLVERSANVEAGLLGLRGALPVAAAEVGAVILPAWQAQGFAAEAIAALAAHAFSIAGLSRLHTRHASANAGAAGLMRKLGFACVGNAAGEALGMRWELRRTDWLDRKGTDATSGSL